MASPLGPGRTFPMGFGFWAIKTLPGAIEIELFTELSKGPPGAAGAGELFQ